MNRRLAVLLCAAVAGGWMGGGLRGQTSGLSQSPSPSPSASPSQSASVSPSASASPSPSLSQSASVSPSASASQSPSQSASVSPSASPSPSLSQSIKVAAQSEARSELIHLKAGNGIEVTGSSDDARFSVDLFVYNSDKELVGKDDPSSTEASFKWRAAAEGDYYVLARNASEGAGTINITVTAGNGWGGKSRGLTPPAATVAAGANYAGVNVYYATDRAVSGSDSRGPTYGPDPDPDGKLHYGMVGVSIPRDHRMGELEGPSILRLEFHEDPEKHVMLQSVVAEDEAGFVKGVSERLSHSQKKEVLVYVHGFNTTFEDAARRTAQISYDMAFDGPVIFYSWPSQGSLSPVAYNKDGRNSALTVPHLEEFLKLVVAKTGATTVDLIAHSMGNRPVTSALRDFAMEDPEQKNKPMFNQVALMAPDIDAELFRQMAVQIEHSAHRVTLYASSRDAALKISEVFAGYQRAGEAAPNLLVLPGMDTVDASAVDTSLLGLHHSYFADSTTVLSDLFHDFMGIPVASRTGLQAVATAAGKYWRFQPGPSSP